MKNKDLEELEYLAEQFIIGTSPLTTEQQEIIENIRAMEIQLAITEKKARRIVRVIDALHKHLYSLCKKEESE